MKHGFWKRFLTLVMAIAIVLSTGVLDSAGRLLASGGETEPTVQETTDETTPPSDQQGGTSTETLVLDADGGEGSGTATGEASTEEVTLTVALLSVYADDSQAGTTLATEVLTYAEGVASQTFRASIPEAEGYTFAISGASMTLNPEGMYEAEFARPEESGTHYITVTYSPIVSQEGEEEPQGNAGGSKNILPEETTLVDTYNFYVDGSLVHTHSVVEGQAVLVPAAPEKDGYKFMGWNTDAGAETGSFSQAASVTGATYDYSAIFQEVFYVFFLDEQDRVKETRELLDGDTILTDGFKITLDDKNKAVAGWSLTKGGQDVKDTLTIQDANVTLYPILVDGYWVAYDTNGGTFMDPDFYYSNERTVDPATNSGKTFTTRPGYTFDGWESSVPGFAFGNTLSQSVTLTAKWKVSTSTKYTIIYWIENADPEADGSYGYTYEGMREASGTTGARIVLSNNTNGYGTGNINSAYRSYFTYKSYDTGKTIAADGTTVVNVYYTRNSYTLTFMDSRKTVATITAKYNAYIADEFTKAPFTTTYNGRAWDDSGNTYQYALQTLDRMPGKNVTFNLYNKSSNDLKTMYYWVEAVEGQTYSKTTTRSGVTYGLLKTVGTYFNYMTYEEEYHPIDGFSRLSASAAGFKNSQMDFDRNNEGHFYYPRNSYDLIYQNVDDTWKTVSLKYQAPLNSYLTSSPANTPAHPAGMDPSFTFGGWYTSPACEDGTEAANVATMPIGGLVVYAKWIAPTNSATVHFDIIVGSEYKTFEVPYGKKISEVDPDYAANVQVGTGLTWDGSWVELVNGIYIPFDVNSPITRPVAIYPNITSTAKYTVSYDANGGTGSVADGKAYYYAAFADVQHTAGITAPSGKVFLEWNTARDGSGTGCQPGEKLQVTDDTTLYAIWGNVPQKVTLTYHANYPDGADPTYTGASVMENSVVKLITAEGAGFKAPAGYTFGGWRNAGGKIYGAGGSVLVTVGGDNNLYAVWAPNLHSVTYTYDGDIPAGADAVPAGRTDVPYASTVTAAGRPAAVEGYSFEGWKYNGNVVTSFTMPDSDVTLVGTWKKMDFKVTYEYTGTVPQGAPAVPAETTATTGSTVAVAEEPSLTGYTFSGWSTGDASIEGGSFTMPAKDVTIRGAWTVNRYTVTYMVDGAQVGEVETYDYNEPVAIRAKYEKEGYTVSDWSITGDFDMPAEDVVITATTSINSYGYTVRYQDEDGKSLHTDKTASADFGTTITAASEVIAIDGYTFVSGNDITITTGSNVMTLVYTQRTDLGYIVKYVWGETEIVSAKEVTGQTFGTTVTEAAAAVDGYTLNDDASKSITITTGENEIVFHYIKDVTFTGETATKTYTGSEQTITGITASGLADGHTYEALRYAAAGTNVGTYDGAFSGTLVIRDADGSDVTGLYNVAQIPGWLTIERASFALVITGGSDTGTYNGTEQEISVFTAAGLLAGHEITGLTYMAEGTDAGEYQGRFSGTLVIVDANGADVTENYAITQTPGQLTILPAPLTVTTDSASKVYDGTALTAEGKLEGLRNGETASFAVTGSQTAVGSSENSYTLTWNGTAKAGNYALTEELGTLTVTESTAEITVTTTGGTWTYDGLPHGATVEVTGLTTGYTLERAESTATATDVTDGGIPATADVLVIRNAEGEDVTSRLNITYYDGTIEINPRPVTFTGETATVPYTGVEQSITGIGQENLVNGHSFEGLSYEAKGTNKGVYEGVFSGDAVIRDANGTDVTGNYTITKTPGQLTIVAIDAELVVTIRGNTATMVYTGSEQTVTGFTHDAPATVTVALAEGSEAAAKGTNVGNYPMGLTAEDFVATSENYANIRVEVEDGWLAITNASFQVTFTGESGTTTYDGSEHVLTGITVTGLLDGHTFENLTYSAKGTNADTYEGIFTGDVRIMDNGVDVTGNYVITKQPGSLVINPLETGIVVTITEHSGDALYDGTEHTVNGYDVDIDSDLYTEADFTFSGDATVSGTDAGSYAMELKAEDFANTNANFTNVEFVIVDGTLEIAQRQVTLTSATDSKPYDGTALTNDTITVTGDGFVNGEGYEATVTGSQTEVGSSTNTFTYTLNEGTNAANYAIKTEEGTLTVTALADKVTVTITEHSGNALYDGTEHTVSGYDVAISSNLYTEADFTFSGDATVSGTDAGSYAMELKAEDFANTNANFTNVEFVIVDGTLEIAKREVTITSGSASKEYDTLPLVKEEAAVTEGSFVEGEGVASYHSFGSRTLVGVSDNTFAYTLKSNTLASNYTITLVPGTLEVLTRTQPYQIVVKANSGERVYNGQPFTVSGLESASVDGTAARMNGGTVTFTIAGNSFTITGLEASRTETDVNPEGGYEVPVEGTAVITDAQGNDVTAQFALTTESGTLTITPAAVKMTSADDTKVYDGTELVNATVTAEGFMAGEGASYDVTGSQTLVGSSENRFSYTLDSNTKAHNYVIETVFGKLTVTAPDAYEIVEKTHETEGVYRLGDTVTFDITVENIFSEEATAVITEQEGVSLLWNGSKVSSIETTIPAGQTITVQAEYIIQEKDILAGEFVNVVDVNIKATVDEIPYEGEDDDDDTVDEIEEPKAQLTLNKETVSTPAGDNGKYVVGEVIRYQITATNTGNLTLHNAVIEDTMTGVSQGGDLVETFTIPGTLAPGESRTFTYEYTVVEEDLGKILINAVAGEAGNASQEDDDEDNDIPTEVIPDEVEDPTDDIRRDLQVTKEVINPQQIYKLYTYIEYEIVITNNGNVTEHDVVLTDTMINAAGDARRFSFTDLDGGYLLSGSSVGFSSIAPGESRTILCRYLIDGKDESQVISNKAKVESDDGETGDEDETEGVPVETLYNLTIYYLSDDWQVVMAPEYHGRYSVGAIYYVESPVIEGYVANYPAIGSGAAGMPAEDVVCYVLYSKAPEEPVDPSDPSDPTEPSTDPTDPTYDLTEIPEDQVPLSDLGQGDHSCCIMHFLIMLAAMILLGFYTKDRKKYQERIHELKRALAAEDAAAAQTSEEEKV